MKKIEINKQRMLNAVDQKLDENEQILTSVPAVVNAHSDLKTVIADIGNEEKDFMSRTKGATADKQLKEDELVEKIVVISGSMYAYGIDAGNEEIKQAADITRSKLYQMPDLELGDKATALLNLADEQISNLTDYGVTQEEITLARNALEEYQQALRIQSSKQAERSGDRTALTGLFQNADHILNNRLDRLMERFKISHPNFYNEYLSARTIYDL